MIMSGTNLTFLVFFCVLGLAYVIHLIYDGYFREKIYLKAQDRKRTLEEEKKKMEEAIKTEKSRNEEEVFNKRMLNYKTIIYEYKLQVSPRYQANFLSEAEILIGDAKKHSPASWIDYETLKGWCEKYVKTYPNEDNYKKENTNHENKSEMLKNKFVEREQFQKERLKNNK